ncbi:LPS export ABC transporter periplasmic protein LptC [Candidatus Poribacteria bacterium]|nr:LPS export ABC transporter periplasmic protein LptC [Candidatus Poribacteria bacterium]
MLPNIDSPKMFRCLMALLCTLGLTFISLSFKEGVDAAEKEKPTPETNKVSKENTDKDNEEAIDGTADEFKQYEKEGLTIFTGHVKINRPNGFLNADKVTIYEDVNTNEAIKTVAEGHVELRDGDIFATSDHAILNHVDDSVELQDNVVVIQDEDRLETKHFTFNRRTGEREGKGEVKFRVRVKQKKQAVEEDKTEQNTERAAPANTSAGEK